MIWHIAKKDFFDNFTSARFIVGFLLCLFLVPYTVYTGTRVFEGRIQEYQKALKNADERYTKAQVYAQVRPFAVQAPSPLSIFCKGISEQVGNTADLRNDEIPTFATGITTIYENQFLNRFVSLDFVNILAIILSLIGIFLSYDIFSRERENGTLKLLLSNHVTRASFFLGKAIGILITFVPLLLVCYILVFIIIGFSPMVHLMPGDYLRLLLLFVASLIYLSFFVFMGSYISSKAKSSSSSLIINLFIWCLLIFLLPNAMSYLGKNMVKTENYAMVKLNLADITTDFWKKHDELNKKVHDEGLNGEGWNICSGWNYGPVMLCFTAKPSMQYERRMHELTAPMVLDYADKKWRIQKHYLDRLYLQQKVIKYLSCLSPSEIMKHIAASLCRTDMETHVDFMNQACNYRNEFYDYYKKNKIYSSYQYFSPHKESEIPKNGEDAQKMFEHWKTTANPKSTFDLATLGYVNTSALPRLIYKEKDIQSGLSDQLWLITGLLISCILLVWITYRSFIKFDIR